MSSFVQQKEIRVKQRSDPFFWCDPFFWTPFPFLWKDAQYNFIFDIWQKENGKLCAINVELENWKWKGLDGITLDDKVIQPRSKSR